MDFYSDDSDPDIDEDLQEDLDALRRSCVLSGTDPDAAVAKVSSCQAAPSPLAPPAASCSGGSSDDDDDDDLALVRSIRENLCLNKASPSTPPRGPASSPRPICLWPPSDTEDDDDEDLETLRAIQRRFSHYHSGTSTGSPNNLKTEALKGHGEEVIAHISGEEFDVGKRNSKSLTRTGFPKAALLLVDALKKNRACQKFIRRKMINIEAKIEENKDLRDRVKCLMDFQSSCRKSFSRILCQKEDPRVRLISSQKSSEQSVQNKDKKIPALSLGPAENSHVSKYKMVLRQFPMSLQKQPWSDVETEKLAKGIKQQYQETLILDSMNNGSSTGDFSAVDVAYALANTGNFEVAPENIRSVLPLINWDKISAMYLPGRSGAECEARWLNCDDPLINHNTWTAQEEKKLLLTVQERGMCNWINIAVALGTHRTPFQCLSRYQRSLNPHILKRAWTKEEDLQLRSAVETFGCNWQFVSASLDGRTGSQCSNRWRKTLIPERTRVGRWSLDEDKRLMVSVKLLGSGSWNKIAQFIPGRTPTQCSERWCNVLDPDLDLGKWRPEEDSKLLASVCEVGPCWSKIAGTMIPHRTDNMCMRRWRYLCRDKLPSVKAAIQIKKSVFLSNFVDRETERPAISPSDLMALVHSNDDRGDENTMSDKPKKRSKRSCKDSLSANDAWKSSDATVSGAVAADTPVNTPMRRSTRKPPRSGLKEQSEENLALPDGVNDSSIGYSASRKMRKYTTDKNEVVQKRMRGSIFIDNEAALDTSVGNEAAIKQSRVSTSVGKEDTVKKRTSGHASGKEREVKKKTKGSSPIGNNGAAKKRMRGSMSVDNEGVVKKRMRGSLSVGDDGALKTQKRGSVSVDNNGSITKIRESSGKSAEDNPIPDCMANAAFELDLAIVSSEERDVDAGKGRRKSIPRPKQINMTEETTEKYSTCTRLADCLSFARLNGTSRNKLLNPSCSVKPLSNGMQSDGPDENLQWPSMANSVGIDTSIEEGSTART